MAPAPAHLFCFDAQLAGSARSSVQLMPVIQFYSIHSVWFVSNAAIYLFDSESLALGGCPKGIWPYARSRGVSVAQLNLAG